MYEGKLLHVYFDEVEISGKTYRREVVSHPGAAAVIPVTAVSYTHLRAHETLR